MTWDVIGPILALVVLGWVIKKGLDRVFQKNPSSPAGDEPAPPSKPNPKSKGKKPKYSDFKGFDWCWKEERQGERNNSLPSDEDLTPILLQEIRDDQRVREKTQAAILKQLESLNAYMRQVYGDPEEK